MSLPLTVRDVDQDHEKAPAAGAMIVRPRADPSYGDRMVTLEDPFGCQWTLATRIEDVDELTHRFENPSQDRQEP